MVLNRNLKSMESILLVVYADGSCGFGDVADGVRSLAVRWEAGSKCEAPWREEFEWSTICAKRSP